MSDTLKDTITQEQRDEIEEDVTGNVAAIKELCLILAEENRLIRERLHHIENFLRTPKPIT